MVQRLALPTEIVKGVPEFWGDCTLYEANQLIKHYGSKSRWAVSCCRVPTCFLIRNPTKLEIQNAYSHLKICEGNSAGLTPDEIYGKDHRIFIVTHRSKYGKIHHDAYFYVSERDESPDINIRDNVPPELRKQEYHCRFRKFGSCYKTGVVPSYPGITGLGYFLSFDKLVQTLRATYSQGILSEWKIPEDLKKNFLLFKQQTSTTASRKVEEKRSTLSLN